MLIVASLLFPILLISDGHYSVFVAVVCVGGATSGQHLRRQGLQGGKDVQLDRQTLAGAWQETA